MSTEVLISLIEQLNKEQLEKVYALIAGLLSR